MNISQERKLSVTVAKLLNGLTGRIWLDKGYTKAQLRLALRDFVVCDKDVSLYDFLGQRLDEILADCCNCGSKITSNDKEKLVKDAVAHGCEAELFLKMFEKDNYKHCWNCHETMIYYKEAYE